MDMRNAIALLLLTTLSWAADFTGQWNLRSNNTDGETYFVVLTLRLENGAWKGMITVDGDELDLRKIEADGDTLRFEAATDEATYKVTLTQKDGQLTGTWEGNDGQKGSIQGKKS
jgi:aminopeptidase N